MCFLIQGDIEADQGHPKITEVIHIHLTEEDLGNFSSLYFFY